MKGSYKRNDIWVDVAIRTPKYNSLTRLKLIGQIRWSSKHNATNNIAQTPLHMFVLIRTLVELTCSDTLEGATCVNILNSWLDSKTKSL